MPDFWERKIDLLYINSQYSINFIAENMLGLARDEHCLVCGALNGIHLTASPIMKSVADIIRQYERKLARNPVVAEYLIPQVKPNAIILSQSLKNRINNKGR